MKTKLYKSKAYLQMEYVINGKSIHQIAEELGCSYNSVREHLKLFGLIRS